MIEQKSLKRQQQKQKTQEKLAELNEKFEGFYYVLDLEVKCPSLDKLSCEDDEAYNKQTHKLYGFKWKKDGNGHIVTNANRFMLFLIEHSDLIET